jgi:hypothetical protein
MNQPHGKLVNQVPAAVTPSFEVDAFIDVEDLLEYAALQRWLDGSEPFVVESRIEHSVAVKDLLPDDASIERSTRNNRVFAVLAKAPNATIAIEVGTNYARVLVTATSNDRAEELSTDIMRNADQAVSDKTSIRVWSSRRGGTYDDHLVETPAWSSIEMNYPSAVRNQLASLMNVDPETKAGARLILWSGETGTGKTTAIRSLAREWSSWCSLQYISDVDQLLTQSDYLSEVLDEPARDPIGPTFTTATKPDRTWRLLIAEDSDEFLRSGFDQKTNGPLARLLNLSDGIFAENHRVMLLFTTNENVNRLHPALIRPGRCLANIEFERFSVSEARTWLGGVGKAPSRPATLAQLLVRRGDIPKSSNDDKQSAPTGAYL